MDDFELKPVEKPKNRKNGIWNFLTVITLLCSCLLAFFFFTIYNNPYSLLNPFRPEPTIAPLQTSVPTDTATPLPPTWTSSPTPTSRSTRTHAPTWTLLPPTITQTPTETGTPVIGEGAPTDTVTPTPTPASAEIIYQESTTMHADSACNWMSVGGQVLDANGEPLQYQIIQLGGSLGSELVNRMTLSGSVPAFGESGFEFILGDHPIASTQELWIQLFDTASKPLTEKIYFDTYEDCAQNLVMVVFTVTQ